MAVPVEDEEVHRAAELLEALVKAHGLSQNALDRRLGKSPGYTSQVLTGRTELKLRHVLEILRALELEPGLFFRALFLAPEKAPQAPRQLEQLLESLGSSPSARPAPPEPPLLDADELDRRIRFAIREALRERPEAE